MAKTIKFNLICDNKPIRKIEDLQNNFSIEDVLAYYNNKLLHRWLEVRDYKEELDKVRAITVDKPIEIIKELIKIFRVTSDIYNVIDYCSQTQAVYDHLWNCSYPINELLHSFLDLFTGVKKYVVYY